MARQPAQPNVSACLSRNLPVGPAQGSVSRVFGKVVRVVRRYGVPRREMQINSQRAAQGSSAASRTSPEPQLDNQVWSTPRSAPFSSRVRACDVTTRVKLSAVPHTCVLVAAVLTWSTVDHRASAPRALAHRDPLRIVSCTLLLASGRYTPLPVSIYPIHVRDTFAREWLAAQGCTMLPGPRIAAWQPESVHERPLCCTTPRARRRTHWSRPPRRPKAGADSIRASMSVSTSFGAVGTAGRRRSARHAKGEAAHARTRKQHGDAGHRAVCRHEAEGPESRKIDARRPLGAAGMFVSAFAWCSCR